MSLVRINRLRCLAGREDVLESRLAQAQDAAQRERGCIGYRWLRLSGGDYLGISEWADEAAWTAHLASPAFKHFFALEQASPCTAGPPEHDSATDIGAMP
ncbi:antibiotic biosynthesis monooxygenase family protein [Dyella sp.]|jgi:quinol monooxygenase YgiN|uniref:putative quinol monooxygenase n=1 Tax=Dyella sp. TaxID=1869338 RepID=UPI002D796903|nr:antibiotic biosynthesis monooxygenase family protein [Dyella sp.]HET6433792.1 antibiotic biosynthesis monooxygenase family protein [Dyella sp.]